MQVHFTPEREAQLSEAALLRGKAAAHLIQDIALRFLQDQADFREGVRRGIDAADRGDFIETTAL